MKTSDATEEVAAEAGAEADDLTSRFAEIEAKLCNGYDDLVKSASEIGDVTSRNVRLHPLAACALAFLAGVTLARLLRR
jgi:hypothetical protein